MQNQIGLDTSDSTFYSKDQEQVSYNESMYAVSYVTPQVICIYGEIERIIILK